MRSFLQHYGMLVVLLALGVCFSIATLREQPTVGDAAGRALAAQMGKAGRRRVLESFTWSAIADRTHQLYTSLLR